MKNRLALGLGILVSSLFVIQPALAALDREKVLKDPGVYGTYAVFKLDSQWKRLDKGIRESAAAEVKSVFQKHAETVVTDTYLLRGLSDRADFMVRVHSTEMRNNQNFLIDLMDTSLGRYLDNTHTFNGLTKKLIYVPALPDELKAQLKAPSETRSHTYAIVVPIRKDAEWWIMPQDARTDLMKEHTEASLPYLKTVKRKLYFSSGLDDIDFLTYFETDKLDDFNDLVIALQRVKENRHNRRFGSPTLLGTVHSLDDVLDTLSR